MALHRTPYYRWNSEVDKGALEPPAHSDHSHIPGGILATLSRLGRFRGRSAITETKG